MHRRDILKTLSAAPLLSAAFAPLLPTLVGGGWVSAKEADAKSKMLTHTTTPHNAEPHLDALVQSWITPNELFYIRSHAPVPKIDAETFRISVEGMVDRPLKISLAQLQNKYKQTTVTATLTCAGNRRTEHNAVKEVGGVPWQAGAIGNAEWTGVKLADILRQVGVKAEAKHVWFEGVDEIERSSGVIPFGASIPIHKALEDGAYGPGALVVSKMNGKTLPPDHGYPLRMVVPGFIGARSVKWLGKIVVSDRPSPNHYVATAYKTVTESTPEQWQAASPIMNNVMNSVTCLPTAGTKVAAGNITVQGYTLARGYGDRIITKVEVSSDGGRRWREAKFTSDARSFCWRLWEADVEVTGETAELIVRATDSAGVRQPMKCPWNLKGYLFNGWHRSKLEVS